MVPSLNPIRCVTVPGWVPRGIFSSVGWLPFLNCPLALPAKRLNPAKRPKTHFDMLRITAPSSPMIYDPVSAPDLPAPTPPFAIDDRKQISVSIKGGPAARNPADPQK